MAINDYNVQRIVNKMLRRRHARCGLITLCRYYMERNEYSTAYSLLGNYIPELTQDSLNSELEEIISECKRRIYNLDYFAQQKCETEGNYIESVIADLLCLNQTALAAIIYEYSGAKGIKIDDKLSKCILDNCYLQDFLADIRSKKHQIKGCIYLNESVLEDSDIIEKALGTVFGNVQIVDCSDEKNLQEIHEQIMEEAHSTDDNIQFLLGPRKILKNINDKGNTYRFLEAFYHNTIGLNDNCIDCLIIGDYLKTSSFLYGAPVKDLIYKKPNLDISVVIPVGSLHLEYLQKEIETCIKQNYSGEFEIIISDNRKDKDRKLSAFCASFNNDRIRYIHTPYRLSLAKSYEYAYLQANGKYIISLGADDGLLSDAFSIIDLITKKYPNEKIIQCNRFLYHWPSEKTNGTIDEKSIDIEGTVFYRETKERLAKIKSGDISELDLPYMYQQIVRYDYLQTIYEITGKIAYGIAQDIYNGVLNLVLFDKILFVNLPLIIAGNSSAGTGFQSLHNKRDIKSYLSKYNNIDIRYWNYFDKVYRDTITFFIPFGTHLHMFAELVKINGMNVADKVNVSKQELIKLIKKILRVTMYDSILDQEQYFYEINKINSYFELEFNTKEYFYLYQLIYYLKHFAKKIPFLISVRRHLLNKKECIRIDHEDSDLNNIYDASVFLRDYLDKEVVNLINTIEK